VSPLLTWKPSRDGSIEAAYLGACRVGYVTSGGLWWTSLVRPEGGAAMGRAASQEAARAALAEAVGVWVEAAGLCSAGLAAAPEGASTGPVPPTEETEAVPSVKKRPIRSKRVL
jgi:hypothetical protein